MATIAEEEEEEEGPEDDDDEEGNEDGDVSDASGASGSAEEANEGGDGALAVILKAGKRGAGKRQRGQKIKSSASRTEAQLRAKVSRCSGTLCRLGALLAEPRTWRAPQVEFLERRLREAPFGRRQGGGVEAGAGSSDADLLGAEVGARTTKLGRRVRVSIFRYFRNLCGAPPATKKRFWNIRDPGEMGFVDFFTSLVHCGTSFFLQVDVGRG